MTPEPMTADATSLPRDPSGRVLKPVKIQVQFTRARGGYRRYVDSFAEAAGFLASPEFVRTAKLVKAVTITMTDVAAGAPAATPVRLRDHGQVA